MADGNGAGDGDDAGTGASDGVTMSSKLITRNNKIYKTCSKIIIGC